MKVSYLGGISREQIERIPPAKEEHAQENDAALVDLHDVFCAVLRLLHTGCQCRALPGGFPKWRTVHAYFQI